MALVQLSDAYIPEVYESYTQVDGPELTAFLQSGIAVRDAGISAAFANGGEINDIPFWKDLDSSIEPNYGTDNPADIAVPNKITSGLMINRIASLNQTYSAADLVSELSGSNPMQRIRNRFS
jgi:hypothetical protein